MSEKLSQIGGLVLRAFIVLFVVYGFTKAFQGENATVYFLLALFFSIIAGGKEIYNRKS